MPPSIFPVLALVAALQAPAPQAAARDTAMLDVTEAFRRALGTAPSLTAAQRRLSAAEARVEQSRAWPNPLLSMTAENVGASRPVSGVGGLGGIEGQLVLGGWLPLGGDRSAARSWAQAHASEAQSSAAAAEADVRVALVEALANVGRDRTRLERARAEAAGLQTLAEALGQQAAVGRASEGDAARAHLAMVSAHAAAAEVAVEAAASESALTSILGLSPGAAVEVLAGPCVPATSVVAPSPAPGPPELAAARARARAADAALADSRARRIPDLLPQLGIRRAGGVSALYVGLSLTLPVLDHASGSVRAAGHEVEAATVEIDRVERSVAAERAAAERGLSALEVAGRRYDAVWFAALERTVSAADARYRLGEGTLTELLDGRRARLQALGDYERWRAQVVIQRARVARLGGVTIDASLLCTPPVAVPQPEAEN